jgi:hypothetical protein
MARGLTSKEVEELNRERAAAKEKSLQRAALKRRVDTGSQFCVNVTPEFRDWYYNLDKPPRGSGYRDKVPFEIKDEE